MFFTKCEHEWEVMESSLTPSPMERLQEQGEVQMKGFSQSMLYSTKIIILACKKCGAIDKTIEKV